MNHAVIRNRVFNRSAMIVTIVIVVMGIAVFFILFGRGKDTVKIGAVLPLSGPGEYVGIEARDGLLLAVDRINARNGINGRRIELIIADSRTDLQEGKSAFDIIEKRHRPLFYVSALSRISVALAPLAEENRVVLVGLSVATARFTENKNWVFRYYTNEEIEARPILSILQMLKAKTLGIIYVNDEYGVSVYEIIKERFEAAGGAVESASFETEVLDYNEAILKLKDMEAICIIGFVSHFKAVFKQLKDANFKGYVLGCAGSSTPVVTSMPETNGVYVAAPIIYDPNYLFAHEAGERYETRYRKPFNLFAANGYDVMILMEGLLRDRVISREGLKAALEEGFIYPGIFGVLDVKPKEHDINFPLHPARIMRTGLEYLKINR